MGGVCLCYPWTGRPVWPLVVALATVPCMLLCSESPAAVVGKMYPRGNHWAVGHLMGKKSIESLQEINSDHITPSETTVATELDRHEPLMAALLQKKTPKQMTPQTIDELLRLRSGWREEDRNKYLRKMTDLLLLAARLQGNDSA